MLMVRIYIQSKNIQSDMYMKEYFKAIIPLKLLFIFVCMIYTVMTTGLQDNCLAAHF